MEYIIVSDDILSYRFDIEPTYEETELLARCDPPVYPAYQKRAITIFYDSAILGFPPLTIRGETIQVIHESDYKNISTH